MLGGAPAPPTHLLFLKIFEVTKMIIENPIVIEMKSTYKFKPKYVPSNEYLLKRFDNLQLDPSKRYLYPKNEEFNAKKAIDLMAFTFESNKFLITSECPIFGGFNRDSIVKIQIKPIHPLVDNYALEPGAYGDYCNCLTVKMDYTEASMFYDNPVMWISNHIEKFGVCAWSAPVDDIITENIWKWRPVAYAYDTTGKLQPRYVTPSDAWNGAKIPSPYSPAHPVWGSNNVQPLYGAPIPPAPNLQATYDNMFAHLNSEDTEEIQKACSNDTSFTGVHEPLSDIFGGSDKSDNS